MSDLEMRKLCAVAMGVDPDELWVSCENCGEYGWDYDPFTNDAQALALVKQMQLEINPMADESWHVRSWNNDGSCTNVDSVDLCRAIVECVAKLQSAKVAA